MAVGKKTLQFSYFFKGADQLKNAVYKLDKERNLKLGFGALAKLEDTFGSNVGKWNFNEFSLKDVATVITEALRGEMPDVDVAKTIALIDEYSDTKEAFTKFNELIEATFGKNDKKAAEAKPEALPVQ